MAVAAIDTIRRATGAAVMVLHHLGANGDRERGSTALRAATDVTMKIDKKQGNVRELTSEKVREFEPFKAVRFRLTQHCDSVVPSLLAGGDDDPQPEPQAADEDAVILARCLALRAEHRNWSMSRLTEELGGTGRRFASVSAIVKQVLAEPLPESLPEL
jgi:hypothetical protein